MKKNKSGLRNLCDMNKNTKICIMGVPEMEERGRDNIWKNNARKLSKFEEDINLHIQEAQQSQDEKTQIYTKTHYNQAVKNERQNPEISKREATHSYKGSSIRITADFSRETLGISRQWDDIERKIICEL